MPKTLHSVLLGLMILAIALGCSESPASPSTPTALPPTPTPPPAEGSYIWWGEELHSPRSPGLKWGDSSNWIDGRSHLEPELPLEINEYIGPNLTCAQAEIIIMVTFPPEYDIDTWHTRSDWEKIADEWDRRQAILLYGEIVKSFSKRGLTQLRNNRYASWDRSCGDTMR